METITTMLYVDALKRDLVRYHDTVDNVAAERIKNRMVDTVDDALGHQGDSVNIVETIMMLPDGMNSDDLVAEIAKIVWPEETVS